MYNILSFLNNRREYCTFQFFSIPQKYSIGYQLYIVAFYKEFRFPKTVYFTYNLLSVCAYRIQLALCCVTAITFLPVLHFNLHPVFTFSGPLGLISSFWFIRKLNIAQTGVRSHKQCCAVITVNKQTQ